jgi:tripartite-type tricarboxylate transporter receptor subunit TctC
MKRQRRQFLHMAAGAAALPSVSRLAWAQAYPARPVRIIVGFPPGGASDTIMRIIAQWLSERLGQLVMVENKPGAATNLAVQTAINAEPDGYSLVYISSSTAINATFYRSLPFDFLRDCSPVGGVVYFPHVMVVNNAVAAATIADFITYVKANPGKINMASYGTGTTSHLAGELFMAMTGGRVTHIPYRGDPQAFTDLLSDRVQMYICTLTAALPHIRAGTLRGLALVGSARSDLLPGVPVLGEFVPNYEVNSAAGLGVKAGTPLDVIETLNREINLGLADPAIKKRLFELGAVPFMTTPAEFGAFMAAETDKWGKVIRAANIKTE